MQPYFITALGSKVIVFAGLWALWKGQDGNGILSCALLSKSASPSIAYIHDRMPVVLKQEHYGAWVVSEDRKRSDIRIFRECL